MSKGLGNIKVRQGAIIINIAPDASVTYSLCMAVPREFELALGVRGDADIHIINNKKFIKKEFGKEYDRAMRFKIALQVEVQTYKNELGEQRRVSLLNRLSELK